MMRRKHDFYPTPQWATRVLLNNQNISGKISEPCSGAGDISNALRSIGTVTTNDIDRNHTADSYHDLTQAESWALLPQCDWIVTNPPFNIAPIVVPAAHEKADRGIAMLLRLSYLEPCQNRAQWLAAHPPTKLIVLPRISFTGDGKTDSCTAAWMIWDKSSSGSQIIVARAEA